MADEIALVRHGEVDNPDGVVYASLPGFGLSDAGRREAAATAAYLAQRPLTAVVASPLLRAQQTAAAIAFRGGLDVATDARLAEWGLNDRWAGRRWDEVAAAYPGEIEAYWEDPTDLTFSPEPLAALAERMAAAAHDAHHAHPEGLVALVSHQDPVQAARLRLTGRPAGRQHHDKPGHAAVILLRPAPAGPWTEVEHWSPAIPDREIGAGIE